MKVLFTVSNWAGHYYPMVPLGRALLAAGHEVRVACTPVEEPVVRDTGLEPAPVLHAYDMERIARVAGILQLQNGEWRYGTPPLNPQTGEPIADLSEVRLGEIFGALPGIAETSVDAVLALVERWRPDLVVHDLLSFEGRLVSQLHDIPGCVYLWGPVGTAEPDPAFDFTPNDYSKAFARLGLGRMDPRRTTAVIDPCPDAIAAPSQAPRLPVRFEPFSGATGSADLDLADRSRPRICLVWGTSVSRIFGRQNSPVPTAVEALAGLDADVLVTLAGPDQSLLGDVPSNVTVLDYAPLEQVLPHCDVVVHSAGGGCTMTSVLAGVPQLLLPNGVDQPIIARRLAHAGVARVVPAYAVDVAGVQEAVRDLITDPAYRTAARTLQAAAQDRPAPAELVARLEQLAATGTSQPWPLAG